MHRSWINDLLRIISIAVNMMTISTTITIEAGPWCSMTQGPHAGLEAVTAQDGCFDRNQFSQNVLIWLGKTTEGLSSTVDYYILAYEQTVSG